MGAQAAAAGKRCLQNSRRLQGAAASTHSLLPHFINWKINWSHKDLEKEARAQLPRGEGGEWQEGTAPAEAVNPPGCPAPARRPRPRPPAGPLCSQWHRGSLGARDLQAGKVHPSRVTPSSCVGTMGSQMAGRANGSALGPPRSQTFCSRAEQRDIECGPGEGWLRGKWDFKREK